ncbi:hypothetical protein KUTeg_001923 [Tegillarca granosa]|uniref:Uncharacterized protein n=1 Tax=Tegillarca granosa TaxID=220873 RepID=A0ABQ9FW06_TEGGR|nr:hypothetical protein KUTeg_001923 [Tegillarca granosa]
MAQTSCNGDITHYGNSKPYYVQKIGNQRNNEENRKVDIEVHLPETPTCAPYWTKREKYLLALCVLLFTACFVFIMVAFVRDHNKSTLCF